MGFDVVLIHGAISKKGSNWMVEINNKIGCTTPNLDTAIDYLKGHLMEMSQADPNKTDVQKAAEKGFNS